MNFFDLLFIITLLGFIGFSRGNKIITNLLLFFSWILGYLLAESFALRFQPQVDQLIDSSSLSYIVTYFTFFIPLPLLQFLFGPNSKPKKPYPFKSLIGSVGACLAMGRWMILLLLLQSLSLHGMPAFHDDIRASFFFPMIEVCVNALGGLILA